MSADDTSRTPPRPDQGGMVLDPEWERVLRSGADAEGEAGSIEPELAVVHLLRHARAPQSLDDAAFDHTWDAIEGVLDREAASSGWRAWLRRPWLAGGLVAAAAATVLVLVWAGPTPSPTDETVADGSHATGGARQTESGSDAATMAAMVEAQFATLEPDARAAVSRTVDADRSRLRAALVADAIAADGRTMGGAP